MQKMKKKLQAVVGLFRLNAVSTDDQNKKVEVQPLQEKLEKLSRELKRKKAMAATAAGGGASTAPSGDT